MDKIIRFINIIPLIFITVMFVLCLFIPSKTFSEEEMRYLQQRPSFSIEKIIDKSYMKKTELYFSDQFPFRSFWIKIKNILLEST